MWLVLCLSGVDESGVGIGFWHVIHSTSECPTRRLLKVGNIVLFTMNEWMNQAKSIRQANQAWKICSLCKSTILHMVIFQLFWILIGGFYFFLAGMKRRGRKLMKFRDWFFVFCSRETTWEGSAEGREEGRSSTAEDSRGNNGGKVPDLMSVWVLIIIITMQKKRCWTLAWLSLI